jgi:DNA-directed RNA polymerase omega subunit
MNHEAIESFLPKSGYSIYTLIRMGAIRALELAEGRKCLVERTESDKLTTLALSEILQGKILLKSVADKLGSKAFESQAEEGAAEDEAEDK